MEKNLIKRELTAKIVNWLEQKEIFVILGPRQSGKTTLLRIIENYLKTEQGIPEKQFFYFSFEDPQVRAEFSKNPKEFVETKIKIGSQDRFFFFLDEYHWIDEGGQKLKMLYDLFPNVKFFITGSSSLELTFKTGKYLVGRAFYFYLFPLSFLEFLRFKNEEVYTAFQKRHDGLWQFLIKGEEIILEPSIYEERLFKFFEEYCLWGGYPEVIKKETIDLKSEVLKNIVSTYLEREIRSLLLIADLEAYQTLLKLLAAQTGQLINYQQLSTDAGLYFKLIKNYLKILEETFVLKSIKPFYRNLTTELKRNPKIYFYDSGLRNFLVSNFAALSTRPDKGQLVEEEVFANLNTKLEPPAKIDFWRTRGRAEVDFVLRVGDKMVPVEVKFSPFAKPKLSAGFRSFVDSYKPARGVVLTGGGSYKIKVNQSEIIFCPVWYL
ncbi:MAG: ATP-binding protein [Candidatus Cloacimonetes bacterium]|nr:ATP-binding protein [Candidatus Cloacimonadota bacterium]